MNYLDYNFGIMDTLKKAGTRALKGWDDGERTSYGKNIALRAGEGTAIGAGTGAIAGNIAGRVKRHKAGQKAREEASKGTINKILNAINGDRLKNIEKEARKKVSLTKHTLAGMGIGAGTGAAAGASAGALETYIKRNRAKNKARDERMSRLEEENKAERAAREKAEKDAERYKAQRGGVIPWAFRGVKKLAGKFMDWRAKKKKEWNDNHYTANDYWNDVGGGNPARFGMQHMSLTNYMTDRGYHEFSSRKAALYSDYNFGYVQGGAVGALKQMVPIYRIYDGQKKNDALSKYDREVLDTDAHGWMHVLGNWLFAGIPGTILHITTSAKFDKLVDDLTKEFMSKHPEANKRIVKREIRHALYYDKESQYVKKHIDKSRFK